MRDDTVSATIFRDYRSLADARRGLTEKLTDAGDALTQKERRLLRAERRRITAEMGRLDSRIAEAAAIEIVG